MIMKRKEQKKIGISISQEGFEALCRLQEYLGGKSQAYAVDYALKTLDEHKETLTNLPEIDRFELEDEIRDSIEKKIEANVQHVVDRVIKEKAPMLSLNKVKNIVERQVDDKLINALSRGNFKLYEERSKLRPRFSNKYGITKKLSSLTAQEDYQSTVDTLCANRRETPINKKVEQPKLEGHGQEKVHYHSTVETLCANKRETPSLD
jgi:hypothetical protein